MNNWWGSIREKGTQIKNGDTFISRDALVVAIIILVGFSAFGLGRLSLLEQERPALRVYKEETMEGKPLVLGGKVVASVRGSKYHYPWCSGARAMSEVNKRWFDSVAQAREAGYEPAGNCKGLR